MESVCFTANDILDKLTRNASVTSRTSEACLTAMRYSWDVATRMVKVTNVSICKPSDPLHHLGNHGLMNLTMIEW